MRKQRDLAGSGRLLPPDKLSAQPWPVGLPSWWISGEKLGIVLSDRMQGWREREREKKCSYMTLTGKLGKGCLCDDDKFDSERERERERDTLRRIKKRQNEREGKRWADKHNSHTLRQTHNQAYREESREGSARDR